MQINGIFFKVFILLVAFWIIGILLSIWFGLGWFLLMETIRRFLFVLPNFEERIFGFLKISLDIKAIPDEISIQKTKNKKNL
jgi:hypothetical protein